MRGEFRLRGLHNRERIAGAAEVEQAAAGGDRLVVAGSGTEQAADFVVASTEALGRGETVEPAHTSCAPSHAAVVLLKPVFLKALVRCKTRRTSVVRIARG